MLCTLVGIVISIAYLSDKIFVLETSEASLWSIYQFKNGQGPEQNEIFSRNVDDFNLAFGISAHTNMLTTKKERVANVMDDSIATLRAYYVREGFQAKPERHE